MRHLLCLVSFCVLCAPLWPKSEEAAAKIPVVFSSVALKRGPFDVRLAQPKDAKVRAIVVLGSGDGGWSYWEDRVLQHLAASCAVVGVDFSKYADKDYDLSTLVADYSTLVQLVRGRLGPEPAAREVPVILGGWSMGAEQAVAACGLEKKRPAKIAGLLLVASGARGRYGLRLRDRAGFAPTGEGTFGLKDFARQLKGLRLAQFHARYDLLDTPGWADGLNLNLRRFDLPRGFHDFEGAGPDFLKLMDDAVNWILEEKQAPPQADAKTS